MVRAAVFGMLGGLMLLSPMLARAQPASDFPFGHINPSTGRPMVPHSNVDVGGTPFGAPPPRPSAFPYGHINPTTGRPMVPHSNVDVGGTPFGAPPFRQH